MSQKAIMGVKITGTINRKDFGIGEKMPEMAISNEVGVVANAEYNKN